MAKYKMEECVDVKSWDHFVENSPQGTIFCKTAFINALGIDYKIYLIKKGQEIVAGTIVLLNENKQLLKAPYPFTPYQGILFKDYSNVSAHKKITEEFKITEFIINEIIFIHNKFSMVHSPFLTDTRPFLWYNYHSSEKGIFNIGIWYTPILNLSYTKLEDYIYSIRTARRQELRKKINFEIIENNNIELLDKLHKKTFKRQNIKRSREEVKLVSSISRSALENNFGRLTFLNIDNESVSAVLFLFDSKRGYYLFGASDPIARYTGSATKLLIENIMYTINEKKLKQVDFVGCNSPNRGDFKISFNPKIYPYFETQYNMNY